MTSGVRKTDTGWEFTRRALVGAAAMVSILAITVGALAGTFSWKTQTGDELASKVDATRFVADSIQVEMRIEQNAAARRQLLDLVTKTETRVSDIWCEQHFKGAPPRSCQ